MANPKISNIQIESEAVTSKVSSLTDNIEQLKKDISSGHLYDKILAESIYVQNRNIRRRNWINPRRYRLSGKHISKA